MRWVVAQPGPSFSVQDCFVGWTEALRELGEHVVEYNLGDRLTFYGSVLMEAGEGVFKRALEPEAIQQLAVNGIYASLYKVRPDVLFVVSGFFIPTDVYDRARSYGTKVVVLHTESPYEEQRQLEVAQHVDINLINDPTNLDSYPPNTFYVPHAYRPSLHTPGPAEAELVCDLGFVGTGYPSRIQFLEQMDLTGLDVLLAGNWQWLSEDSPLRPMVGNDISECLDNADGVRVYRSARCGINLYRREAEKPELSQGWAMGPREVEMAAVGCFFLRDPRGEGDEVLSMLPTFTSPQEATDLLRWWVQHEDERVEVARKAREAVADRTFTKHAAGLLRLLAG